MALARASAVTGRGTGSAPAPAVRDDGRGTSASGARLAAGPHIRRCLYRRVTAVRRGRRELPMYDVDCLHPTYEQPVPLGNLAAASAACAACPLPGIFRADED